MDFLPFSGQKTQKILPGRDATCVHCRISFILVVVCPGGAPHALPEVGCNPSNRSGTCCGRGWFRYGRRGPSVAPLRFASAKRAQFFHVLLCPSRARTQKIVPFRVRMDFLRFSGPKTQKILPGRDATCVRCRISFILAVACPDGAPHALAKVGCNPSNRLDIYESF